MRDLDALDLDADDPFDLLRDVAGAGARIRELVAGVAGGGELADVAADGRPRALLVLAAGADVVAARALELIVGASSPVPVVVSADVVLPAFVGSLDLVLVLASGAEHAGTPRAGGPGQLPAPGDSLLPAVAEAARRGARLVSVAPGAGPIAAAVRSGRGVVLEVARGASGLWPAVAGGLLVAAAAGVAAVGAGGASGAAGLLEMVAGRLDEVAVTVRPGAETFTNPAKSMALGVAESAGRTGGPMLWGTTALAGLAAARGAEALRRVAGVPAVAGTVLAAVAGESAVLAGTPGDGEGDDDVPDDLLDDPLEALFRDRGDETAAVPPAVVLLRDGADESPAETAAASLLGERARALGCVVHEVASAGEGRLERWASLVGLLDATAVYTALAVGRQPGQD